MSARIFIAIACHNRRAVAEQCLPTMPESLGADDMLYLYDDCSSEYDPDWLMDFIRVNTRDEVISLMTGCPIGIQGQRRKHLADFLRSDAEFCYLTDHDMLHDPSWADNAITIQALAGGSPLCLYDTAAHVKLGGNTIQDDPESAVLWRRVAPGCSYFLTREHVEALRPHISTLQHFDWQIPALLGGRFAVSRVGYCDHIGVGGAHHPVEEGLDGGDRVLRPTPWLVKKRAEVVAAISQTV